MGDEIYLCRICLKTENLLSIFEKNHDENNIPIWAKIIYCASVQVSEGDLLPKLICNQCSHYLDIAYTFKTLCETTDKKLRSCASERLQENNAQLLRLESTVDELNLKEYHKKHNEFTKHEQAIEDLLLLDIQMPTIDAETVISSSINYESREQNPNYGISICETVNQCSFVSNDVDLQNKDISNSDVDRDIPKDILKVGRHIAKKNSGKFPQKIQATITKKKQIANKSTTDILLNDVSYEDECHILHGFEEVLESDLPIVGLEKTIVTDNTFYFDVHTEVSSFDSILEQTKATQNVNISNKINKDIFMTNNISDVVPKVKLKIKYTALRRGNKRVNVFDDRHIKHMKPRRKSQELIKKINTRSIKKNNKIFKCNICSKAFPFKSHLERHTNMHTGIKKFSCDFCQRKFINSYNLSVHVLRHTDEFPLKCHFCKKGFANRSLLKRHEATHTDEKKFQCRYCPVKLKQSSSLRLHEKMHLHRPSYHCDVCYKVFSYTNSLAAHKKQHYSAKRYTCDSCSNTFSRKSSLLRHIQGHHKTKKLKCKFCGEYFNTRNAYTLHLRSHRHECKVCGDSFQYKTTLVHHLKTHKDMLKCEQCFKVFSTKVQFLKHLKKHIY